MIADEQRAVLVARRHLVDVGAGIEQRLDRRSTKPVATANSSGVKPPCAADQLVELELAIDARHLAVDGPRRAASRRGRRAAPAGAAAGGRAPAGAPGAAAPCWPSRGGWPARRCRRRPSSPRLSADRSTTFVVAFTSAPRLDSSLHRRRRGWPRRRTSAASRPRPTRRVHVGAGLERARITVSHVARRRGHHQRRGAGRRGLLRIRACLRPARRIAAALPWRAARNSGV